MSAASGRPPHMVHMYIWATIYYGQTNTQQHIYVHTQDQAYPASLHAVAFASCLVYISCSNSSYLARINNSANTNDYMCPYTHKNTHTHKYQLRQCTHSICTSETAVKYNSESYIKLNRNRNRNANDECLPQAAL